MKAVLFAIFLFFSSASFAGFVETPLSGENVLAILKGTSADHVNVVGNNWLLAQQSYRGFKEILKVQLIQEEKATFKNISDPMPLESGNRLSQFEVEIRGMLFRTPKCSDFLIQLKGRIFFKKRASKRLLFSMNLAYTLMTLNSVFKVLAQRASNFEEKNIQDHRVRA